MKSGKVEGNVATWMFDQVQELLSLGVGAFVWGAMTQLFRESASPGSAVELNVLG